MMMPETSVSLFPPVLLKSSPLPNGLYEAGTSTPGGTDPGAYAALSGKLLVV